MRAQWTKEQVESHNARVTGKGHGKAVVERMTEFIPQPFPETKVVVQKSTDEEKLNKLETAWLAYLRTLNYPWVGIQNITLKLGDDCRYSPDFFVVGTDGQLISFETKGGLFRDDAKVKLKVAARCFPWIKFILVTRPKGQWKQEEVKP